MNLQKQMLTMETKAKLSTLWIFVLLNVIFRDLHELAKPEYLEELMNGQVTEQMLLLAGFMIEVPIAMVLLSRLLPYGANRWTNIIAAVIVLSLLIMYGTTDLDDTFFIIVKIAALSLVIWTAWRWRNPYLKQHTIGQEVSS
ncbi:hypothetical protein XM38_015600 [Halomicronema hongdechloris C2206]|uniref:DoxX family protein n=1 Tax=Halomicronema hongdechloris C2206 TaxID=1641165 RepID=A0A1Z3HJY8_9CYAN|nr:DUF6326 family protein [Halomicronema hongdechloris]ASC70620.1 hypothetical protein XM38_015600 [Halomicronema hongdechloris C2206]